MSYRDKTYIIFDGDNDQWAYRYMRGWKALENIDFNFEDAHDLYPISWAQNEAYIKSKLRDRFSHACQIILLIGKQTKNLYRYVRWELEVALDLELPIIAVNLNNNRNQDTTTCPPIIRQEYVVYIPFQLKIIKYSLDQFPKEFKKKKS